MNYEEMSDFELSAAIIEVMNDGSPGKPYPTTKSKSSARADNGVIDHLDFDINNWADIGPLIEEMLLSNGFMLKSTHGFNGARVLYKNSSCTDASPKRAAAICYLKMMESGK